MRKEVIIAILIGFILGLIITYGAHTANKAVENVASPSPQVVKPPEAESPLTNSPILFLDISEPENNIVTNKGKISISGTTEAETVIAIIAEENEELLTSDEKGLFTQEISLISGVNNIKIVSINKDNKSIEKNVTVVYSTKL